MEAIRSLSSSSQASSREVSPERPVQKEAGGLGNGKEEGRHSEGDETPRTGTADAEPRAASRTVEQESHPTAPALISQSVQSLEELLRNPVEFVPFHEESTSLGVENKYTPINSPASDATVVSTSSNSTLITEPIEEHKVERQYPSVNERPLHMSWWPIEFPPQPLTNLGNTCFLNSALQALLWCPPLAQALLEEPLYEECPHLVKKGKHFFCALCTMIRVVRRVHSSIRAKFQQRNWAPQELVSNITRIMPIRDYDVGLQQDAHEFLIFLRERLSSACASLLPPASQAKNAPPRPPTLVERLFNVKTRSRVKCERCGYCSDSFSDDMDLGLDIRRCSNIRDALHALSAIEVMKGANAYHCEKCNMKVSAEKSFALMSAPPVLTLFLKRFTAFSKLKHLVHYPPVLDLGPYLARDCPPQECTTYRLFSVLLHHGEGTHSGHYHTLVEVPVPVRGKVVPTWYDCNDDFIREKVDPMGRKEAYLLFYVRDDSLSKGLPSKPLPKPLPTRPPLPNMQRNGQRKATGVTVKNTNGKRILMSDGEEDEEEEKESPKRAKLDGPLKLSLATDKRDLEEGELEDVGAPVISTPTSPTKSPEGNASKWRKAQMQPVNEDVGVSLRDISISPGKNANGKRSSSEAPADDELGSPKRQRLGSMSLPPSSPITPKAPQVSPAVTGFAGLPAKPPGASSGNSIQKGAQRPKQGPSVPAGANLPPIPPSPTAARGTGDAFDRPPLSPVQACPSISPSLLINSFGPRALDPSRRTSDVTNVTSLASSSPAKENLSAHPSSDGPDRGWEDGSKMKAKPNVKKKYGRQSNGGKNPYSSAIAGGVRRPNRRVLM